MLVERYCAGQVVFFSVHEPALNAAVESLYVPIATKTCKTAPHFSTLRLQGYSLNARPTRSALVLWGHSTESSMARDSCKSYAYILRSRIAERPYPRLSARERDNGVGPLVSRSRRDRSAVCPWTAQPNRGALGTCCPPNAGGDGPCWQCAGHRARRELDPLGAALSDETPIAG